MPTNKKFAVITGASSGIGYELASQFAQHGFDLLIAAEDNKIVEAAQRLSHYGVEVTFAQCDLAKLEEVDRLYQKVLSSERVITAIAINAGIGVGGKFLDSDIQKELNLINLNITSLTYLTKLIARHMRDAGEGGRILLTSSIASRLPSPYQAVYAASKAFVQSLASALRYEFKEYGISVCSLMPGPTETNFFHRAGLDDTKIGVSKKDDPKVVAKLGFEACMKDKDYVIAGSIKTRISNAFNDFLPEQLKTRIIASSFRPGSANEVKKRK